MAPIVLLTYYCLMILAASIAGGMIPLWFRLTHRRMEAAISFVAGVMLGVGLLHMLPHAVSQVLAEADENQSALETLMLFVLLGLLAMFLIQRFFSFQHHNLEDDQAACDHTLSTSNEHQHGRDLSWSGAALGLTLHSVIAGVALAASVAHGHAELKLPGLGTFLVILLHKPFDSMTIGTLLARGGWSLPFRHLVNGLFSLAIPVGVAFFYVGLMGDTEPGATLGYVMAFAAGTFLCVSLSDLLPELKFHDHDRVLLTTALLAGLALAWAVCQMESLLHTHG